MYYLYETEEGGIETTTRNGSDIIEYIPLLAFDSKNYIIFLVGETCMLKRLI